jgi:very-short-patch-repair endonuclease
MSFGPLNRDGGERRLNVLISRARLAMDVFSNFTDDDIDLNRTNARGVVALKHFLAYAKTGILEQPYSTGKEPDSPFEEAVIKALVQNGIAVEPQVGTAGFFIDIAVKDQENPGRYIMGIECDGATYHSSRSARDRDRLRQEVLEGLGWRLHRIWSTEWYRSAEQELERTLAAIEKAKLDYRSGVVAQAPKVKESAAETQITRDESAQRENDSHCLSAPYKRATLRIALGNRELHEIPASQLLSSILQVVEQESPIHKTELIRRITEGAGLKRSGSRIQAAVQSAIKQAVRERKLTQKGDFIWLPDMTVPPVRDRSDLEATAKKFEFVAPEEIRLALLKAVESGFSLSDEDAVSSAARLLGFQRVTAQAKGLFDNQLASLLNDGTLVSRNGLTTIG